MSASKFPNEIYNGITDARPDLAVVQAPTHNDWRLMLHEVEAMQRYILNLAGNIKDMPNLDESISDATAQVREMLAKLADLSPPPDVQEGLAALAEKLTNLADSHVNVKRGVKKLLLRTKTVEDLYKKLEEEVDQQLEIIRNQVRNQLAAHAKKTEMSLRNLQKQIDELHDTLTDTDI
jgi:predicted  nucleic acid-binding Zn-ribbon protein